MTKETRIGLLVGLLFIIMFGLILGELTGPNSLPPSPAVAEENVESYAATPAIYPLGPPGGGRANVAPGAPAGPAPGGGPPADDGGGIIEVAISPAPTSPRPGGALETELARDLPTLTARRQTPVPPAPVPPTPRPPAPAPRPRTYTVKANDTLIEIAREVYGARHAMSYKLIYGANRNVLSSESRLTIGQKLVIPPLPTPAAAPARPTGGGYTEMDAAELARRFSGAPRPAEQRIYVVQRGDSLTAIAGKVLGDDSPEAVRKLYQANRDRMAGPDILDVGVKLRVPQ